MAAPPGLAYHGDVDKVIVDRGYPDALVRRANLHDSTPLNPASVTISRAEYDNLLRMANDYRSLRNALIMGGAAVDTLDILVNPGNAEVRKDSMFSDEKGFPERSKSQKNTPPSFNHRTTPSGNARPYESTQWRPVSYGATIPDETVYDDEDDIDDETAGENVPVIRNLSTLASGESQRTLFFSGLAERTSYKDLMSVIKGGKIISSVIRTSGALVTFATGAAEYLAWSKRNDIYLQGKRIEVNRADHQFSVHGHINDKIARGVTRNILIRNATFKGLTERRIRDDMEHISHLVIIDVQYRGADAYVYTNSIGYATFARTCMMSRVEYKGCKIWFFDDECDVALPTRRATSIVPPSAASNKKAQRPVLPNRFGLLNTEGTEAASDEENQDPDASEYEDTTRAQSEFGVRLDFLDSEG